MADWGGEFSFFQGIHVRIDISIDIFIFIKPMINKFSREVHLQDLTQMRLIKQVLVTFNVKITWQTKNIVKHISLLTEFLGTPGRMITYFDGLLAIRSHDPWIMWSCEITWQTKLYIYVYGHQTWQDGNLSWWIPAYKVMTFWSRGLDRLRDQLKSLHLHYHSVYGHQTWQDGNLPWWARTHKATWPIDHVILWDHVKI